jgi:hypothetical protein
MICGYKRNLLSIFKCKRVHYYVNTETTSFSADNNEEKKNIVQLLTMQLIRYSHQHNNKNLREFLCVRKKNVFIVVLPW